MGVCIDGQMDLSVRPPLWTWRARALLWAVLSGAELRGLGCGGHRLQSGSQRAEPKMWRQNESQRLKRRPRRRERGVLRKCEASHGSRKSRSLKSAGGRAGLGSLWSVRAYEIEVSWFLLMMRKDLLAEVF